MQQGETNVDSAHLARVREMLFSTAAEGLVLVDHAGDIRMHNPRLLELFGYGEGELLGRSIELLLPEAARAKHVEYRLQYNQHPTMRHMGQGRELNGLRKDGSIFPVEVGLHHFNVDNELYVMGLVTDITERRKAQIDLQTNTAELEKRVEERTAELAQGAHAVEDALEREKELNALKSRFVSMASHEFRTPLSTIMGSADLIARYTEGPGNERVHKHVQRIRTKVRDLTAILDDFLSFERIDQGDATSQPEQVDIVDLCIGLVEELRGMAKPGQALEFDHSSEGRTLIADRGMLVNTITNLLTNAIKYSPEGRPVILRTQIVAGMLSIIVIDKGIGIPVEDRPHLYDPFFRAHNVLTIQGTGLGLNLVKRYLDLMHGTITFTSKPGKGTTFTVQIPQQKRPQ